MKLFSIDVMIAATAYILADSEEEAKKKADSLIGEGIEFSSTRQYLADTKAGDLIMTGESYHRDMPELSLSPAMTIHSPDHRTLDEVDDLDEEEAA